jgi:hypothetical protein
MCILERETAHHILWDCSFFKSVR